MPSHLYQRGKIWHCWYYEDGKQIRKSTHCTDKAAAAAVLRDYERSAADPSRVSSKTTLGASLNTLIDDREAAGRAAGTMRFIRTKGGQLARVLGRETPLARIDARAVDAYVQSRLSEGTARHTIGHELSVLRATLKLALRRREWAGVVEAVLPIRFEQGYRPRATFLTQEQLERLLDALDPGRAARVAWIVATACRWSESSRARREDVGLASVAIRGTKTPESAATVPILATMRSLLERAIRDADGPTDGPMFAYWGNCWRDIKHACERAGIHRVSPNDLRRTHATWLRQAGVSPHLIAAMLRHTTSAMVERVYGRMPADSLGDAVHRELRDAGVIAQRRSASKRSLVAHRETRKRA